MSKAWFWVLIGGIFETLWATTMDLSDGFSDLFWTVVTILILPISVVFLNKGMSMGLPTGPSYSVWVGIGAIGSVIVGMILFGEFPSISGYFFLLLIIAGVIGLNMVTKSAED